MCAPPTLTSAPIFTQTQALTSTHTLTHMRTLARIGIIRIFSSISQQCSLYYLNCHLAEGKKKSLNGGPWEPGINTGKMKVAFARQEERKKVLLANGREISVQRERIKGNRKQKQDEWLSLESSARETMVLNEIQFLTRSPLSPRAFRALRLPRVMFYLHEKSQRGLFYAFHLVPRLAEI